MPLQFSYFETCHYNSSYIRTLPFYTSSTCLGPLSGRICVRIFCRDENTTAASLPPLNDVRAPLVRFFFNLRLGGQRRAPALGARPRAAAGSQRRAAAQAPRRGRRRWHRRWLLTDPPCSRRHGPAPELPRPHAPARKEGSRAVPCSPPGCRSRRRACRPSFRPPLAGR